MADPCCPHQKPWAILRAFAHSTCLAISCKEIPLSVNIASCAIQNPTVMHHFDRSKVLILPLVLLPISCTTPSFTSEDHLAIRSGMQQQEQAWNRGDIPGFMDMYADSVCFISAKERTCGKEGVTARYAMRYPDRGTMGQLEFDRLEILGAGADHAWCTGRWRLLRIGDTLSGGFSLFWIRTPEGWRILRDHTY